ncbi:MAG: alpha/beta fold hydrolase [Myxococcales bacterium]|nr:alpha/beta fold hydrolase [Myxococcales bacterium]
MARALPALLALSLAALSCKQSPRIGPETGPSTPEPEAAATTPGATGPGAQQVASLGTCTLESGEKITDCKVGYRTFGKLDAKRGNVVLFPTWFTGATGSLVDVVPDKLVDTKRFYVVLVDALADGVSSSPSNAKEQGRLRFPKVTIGDMVESQRRLLREVLKVDHVHTVMGISMGGMQALEWATRHPTELDHVASIVGTPQLTSQDLLLWTAELHALESDVAYKGGEYTGRPQLKAVQDIHHMMLTTPAYRAKETSRAEFPTWISKIESDVAFDWNDWRRQLEAMMAHDVARADDGKLEQAAKRVKAKALLVVDADDHMVHPEPSRVFARAAGAKLVELHTGCGHMAPGCAAAEVTQAVAALLAQ